MSGVSNSNNKYDPNFIIQSANEVIRSNPNDFVRGQMIFQQALMDWTDDLREGDTIVINNNNNNNDHNDPKTTGPDGGTTTSTSNHNSTIEMIQNAIGIVWIGYCHYLMNRKQYQSAFDAYEQATNREENPYGYTNGILYLEYCRYAIERKKYKIAQNVFIKALVRKEEEIEIEEETMDNNDSDNKNRTSGFINGGTVQDEQDRQLLWNEFLNMMKIKNPTLTMEQLQQAVMDSEKQYEQEKKQHNQDQKEQQSSSSMILVDDDDDDEDDENNNKDDKLEVDKATITGNNELQQQPVPKKMKMEENDNNDDDDIIIVDRDEAVVVTTTSTTIPIATKTNKSSSTTKNNKTHVILAESIELESQKMLMDWQVILPNRRITPPNLISSNKGSIQPQSQPLVVYKLSLPSDVVAAWMVRDGNESPQPPNPPLFQSIPPKLADPTAKDILGLDLALQLINRLLEPSGDMILQVCDALWSLQALKQKETTTLLQQFDEKMLTEYEQLEKVLAARLAGVNTNTTSPMTSLRVAVEQMNQNERLNFQTSCSTQRLAILNQIGWDLRYVLYIQQKALYELHVPGFYFYQQNQNQYDDVEPTSVDHDSLVLQSKVCHFLHSAFFIRNRIGIQPHELMLKNQITRLGKEKNQESTNTTVPVPQQVPVQGTHTTVTSSSSSPVPPTQSNYGMSYPSNTPLIPMDQHQPPYVVQQHQQPPLPIMTNLGIPPSTQQPMMLQQQPQQQQQYVTQAQYPMYQTGYVQQAPTTQYMQPQQQATQQQQYYYPTHLQQQVVGTNPLLQQQAYLTLQQQQQQQQIRNVMSYGQTTTTSSVGLPMGLPPPTLLPPPPQQTALQYQQQQQASQQQQQPQQQMYPYYPQQ